MGRRPGASEMGDSMINDIEFIEDMSRIRDRDHYNEQWSRLPFENKRRPIRDAFKDKVYTNCWNVVDMDWDLDPTWSYGLVGIVCKEDLARELTQWFISRELTTKLDLLSLFWRVDADTENSGYVIITFNGVRVALERMKRGLRSRGIKHNKDLFLPKLEEVAPQLAVVS